MNYAMLAMRARPYVTAAVPPPPPEGWNLSTATYVRSFSVLAQDTSPTDVQFKPDGSRMYIVGNAGDDINEYWLSTAWDISTASYVRNRAVSLYASAPSGIAFKPDGTRMYLCNSSNSFAHEWSLSVAWDISTASWLRDFGAIRVNTNGLFFKPDGTIMYGVSSSIAEQYSLSTPWDISTASYVRQINIEFETHGVAFKPDGTRMYTVLDGASNVNDVRERVLSTAWDISTASYLRNISIDSQEDFPRGVAFSPDGTRMYIVGASNDTVYEYSLTS